MMPTPVTKKSAEARRIVAPTREHHALAQECRRILAGDTFSVAREAIVRINVDGGPMALDRLEGKIPSSRFRLEQAARIARRALDAAALDATWPRPPAIDVPRLRGKLTLDADRAKPVWAQRPALPICFPCGHTNTVTPHATGKLLWDETHLYYLFDVPDHDIQTPYTQRGQSVSQADCVEFFIMSEKAFGHYIEVNASPLGVTYDTLNRKRLDSWGGVIEKPRLADGLQLAVSIRGEVNKPGFKSEGYTVEIAFPFALIPGMEHGAKRGDAFWGLLGWANRDGHGESSKLTYYSHTPIIAWFHNIWGYSRFTLA